MVRQNPRMAASTPPVTVTLNPALDLSLAVDTLVPGTVHRASRFHLRPGGKGVNVSALLGRAGIASTATGFLGRDNAEPFEQMFRTLPVDDGFLRLPGATRTGIKIQETAADRTTDLNQPGLEPDADAIAALHARLLDLAQPGRWIVWGGSLPPGYPAETFAAILSDLKHRGARLAVDSSGPALAAAVAVGVDLIKPNQHELEELTGRPLPTRRDLHHAALRLHDDGIPHVILSLGADGALFAAPDGRIHASAPPVRVASTVGAGDALLAGYLAGLLDGAPLPDRARLACAFAASSLESLDRPAPAAADLAARLAAVTLSPPESCTSH